MVLDKNEIYSAVVYHTDIILKKCKRILLALVGSQKHCQVSEIRSCLAIIQKNNTEK